MLFGSNCQQQQKGNICFGIQLISIIFQLLIAKVCWEKGIITHTRLKIIN